MPLIILIVALTLLKLFAVWKFATLSWGWIIALAVFAFIWFEYIEIMLGLHKRKSHDENARWLAERVKRTFKK